VLPNSKEWWEAKYKERDMFYGKEPSQFLVEHSKLLRRGKVLDLAVGEGRNAVYLASKGFEVEGIDFCDTALKRSEKFSKEMGLSIALQNKDIDMFLLPLMIYDTVLIVDFKPSQRFLKDINRGLVQGGVIAVDAFTTDQVKHYNNTKNGPQLEMFECYKPNELLKSLNNVHVVFYQEREIEPNRFRVQCIARKTGLVG
jgi:SAM-dependent methyltransferase